MGQPMDLTEKLLRREDKYKGILMDVHVDTVELPNGGTSLREVADHTGLSRNELYAAALERRK